jgi:hypothetical protein
MVEIVEHYRDWQPPSRVRSVVEDLLGATPSHYLRGLRSVVLTNSGSLTGPRRRGKTRSRQRKVAVSRCLGLYHGAWRGQPAHIEIFVDNCLAPLPVRLRRVAIFQELQLGPTYFHEIGHHIHSTVAPEHCEREDVADRWSRQLFRAYFRQRHGFLRAALVVARPFLRLWLRWQRATNRRAIGAGA